MDELLSDLSLSRSTSIEDGLIFASEEDTRWLRELDGRSSTRI